MTLEKFKIESTHTFVAMKAGNYYNKHGMRWWLLIFCICSLVISSGRPGLAKHCILDLKQETG